MYECKRNNERRNIRKNKVKFSKNMYVCMYVHKRVDFVTGGGARRKRGQCTHTHAQNTFTKALSPEVMTNSCNFE